MKVKFNFKFKSGEFNKSGQFKERMVGQNFIVINGVRYDVVSDLVLDPESNVCLNCGLYEKCLDSNGAFCFDLFSRGIHFEENKNIHYVAF